LNSPDNSNTVSPIKWHQQLNATRGIRRLLARAIGSRCPGLFKGHFGGGDASERRSNCQSVYKCTRLQDFAHTISKFSREWCPGSPSPVLGLGHQFLLGSPAFPLFLFYETTTGFVVHCYY